MRRGRGPGLGGGAVSVPSQVLAAGAEGLVESGGEASDVCRDVG